MDSPETVEHHTRTNLMQKSTPISSTMRLPNVGGRGSKVSCPTPPKVAKVGKKAAY